VVTFAVDLPEQEYPDAEAKERFYTRLLRDLEGHQAVGSAGGTSLLPTRGDFHLSYEVSGSPGHVPETQLFARGRFVLPGYFRTMGIPVLSGREVEARDGGEGDRVVVVNEAFSRRHWPDGDAVGKNVVVDGTRYQVVGVVWNTMDWDRRAEPTLYLSASQANRSYLNLVVRAEGPIRRLRDFLGLAVATIDPNLPVLQLQTMDEVSQRERVGESALARFVPVVAGIALLLAMVGIYGLTAHAVSRRTREIGIRMAVGARGTDVLGLVTQQSMTPVLLGVAIGAVLALALARGLSAFLFGVRPFHLPIFSGVALAVLVSSILAACVPARRAARVDPVVALREE
jgi:putative ABC transport system permease protein